MSTGLSLPSGNSGFVIPNFSKENIKTFDLSGWRKSTPEEIFKETQEKAQRAENEAKANDPNMLAEYRAVKAHTVFRQGGVIVGAIFRDGQTIFTNNLNGVAMRVLDEARGLPPEMQRNFIAGALMKRAPGIIEERYGETGWSPSRGSIYDNFNKKP
ncbi:hypothetical protein M2352_004449 [Azospirillum fermentarium]|uniref:hypothetical protein n=1 Tax=Azospirillum fermentarium TaxID=1233114 RepID=UPI002227D3B0|nr:hypothetical protein [Azospirillum fermentarium]MCW2248789.1 hypothetical protein [Azospirillum fermentarium]